MSNVTLFCGDCVKIVPEMPPHSVDAIITDIPYGTTACKWDSIIPFDDLWRIVKHVLKPRGAFVTTASQPFTSKLVCSNLDWFRYEWIWKKEKGGNFASCRYSPMKIHENVLVFYGKNYYPVMKNREKKNIRNNKPRLNTSSQTNSVWMCKNSKGSREIKYPESIIETYSCREYLHPTQKPVALYEYLIRTYTNEGDTVLDICAGSGTTGVACVNTNRNFIGIELLPEYHAIMERRIREAQAQPRIEAI